MSDPCKSCNQNDGCSGESCSDAPEMKNNIKTVVAIMSGKGGVGKSSVNSCYNSSEPGFYDCQKGY